MTQVGFAVGGGESFTFVGKVAPPKPTTPHSLMRSTICFWSRVMSFTIVSVLSIVSTHSSPSTSIVIVFTGLFARSFTIPIDFTVPLTEECTGAETKPVGVPINCPTLTLSPTWTQGAAGAPRCCPIEIYTIFGIGSFSICAFCEIFLSAG